MKEKTIELFEVSKPVPAILTIEIIRHRGELPRYILKAKVKANCEGSS